MMTYKRARRSVFALIACGLLIAISLTCCSSRTDWKPKSVSVFDPSYYNKGRGKILDDDGKVLAETVIVERVNSKGQQINKNKYFRVYNVGPEFANVLGSIVPLKKRVFDKETGKWSYFPYTMGPEGGELAFSRWILLGDDPTSNTGGTVQLTINSSVQTAAYNALIGFRNKWHDKQNTKKDKNDKMDYCRKGAAVVMDCETGAVIAYADIPSVDYKDFASIKYVDQYIDFKNEDNENVLIKDGMLYDYCNALNTPGSTFKLLSCILLEKQGVVTANTKVQDRGVFEYNISDNGKYSRKIYDHDAKSVDNGKKKIPVDKGIVSVKTGITDSLNVVFAELAKSADRNQFRKDAREDFFFDVGYRVEEDDPSYSENPRIRTDFGGINRPKLNVDNNQLYFDTSYGMGEVMISPIVTTMITASIINESGDLIRPYMVQSYINAAGKEVSYEKASYGLRQGEVLTKNAVSQEAREIIISAMKNHSSAKKKGGIGVKTGTAKLDNKSNISMTGFVEDRNGKPRYAVTVCMFEMRKSSIGGGSLEEAFFAITDELRKLPGM